MRNSCLACFILMTDSYYLTYVWQPACTPVPHNPIINNPVIYISDATTPCQIDYVAELSSTCSARAAFILMTYCLPFDPCICASHHTANCKPPTDQVRTVLSLLGFVCQVCFWVQIRVLDCYSHVHKNM